MSKFKYISKKGQVSVILKLVSGEQINTGEAAYFAGNFFNGFLRPASDGSGKIIYTGGQGISLSQFLRHPVTKDQFFIIIAQLLEAYKTIVCANLNPACINLDLEVITINENTGELYLVYQPILNLKSPNQGFMRCFALICSKLSFVSPADKAGVDGFVNFARQLSAFSVNDIENYIMYVSPFTYSHVQRKPMPVHPAQSAPAAVPGQMPGNFSAPEPARPVQSESSAAPVKMAGNFSAPEPTRPVQPEPAAAPVKMAGNFSAPEPIRPAQPGIEKAPEDIPAQPLSDFSPKNNISAMTDEKPPTVDFPVKTEVSDADSVDILPESSAVSAKLFRRATGEYIDINKDEFVIGKERAKVDYAISGNKTVSRVHATIYHRDDVFMVVDNGSTNRTCINGSPIPPLVEIRLNSGDTVKFSNEEFDFTI